MNFRDRSGAFVNLQRKLMTSGVQNYFSVFRAVATCVAHPKHGPIGASIPYTHIRIMPPVCTRKKLTLDGYENGFGCLLSADKRITRCTPALRT